MGNTFPKNILFVSHDASRSGAPIVLLNFLKWLKENKTYKFSILLKSGGILTEQFREIAPTYILNSSNRSLLSRFEKKVLSYFFKFSKSKKVTLNIKLKNERFDLIYLNTAVSIDLAQYLTEIFKCPVLAHVHENEFATTYLYPNGFNQNDLNSIKKFIAVSNSTENNLINKYQIPKAKIDVIYPLININKQYNITTKKEDIIKELDFENSFIIGGSGECNWRKGVDLFIQLAFILNKIKQAQNIKFLWVGHYSYEFICQTNYELKKMGLTDKVKFIGSKSDPQNYFQILDIFTLTSREDPFPLVALEAAAMKKPIMFFENAGGMSELFSGDTSKIKSEFADISEMADNILYFFNNRELLLEKGKEAANLVRAYDIQKISSLLVEAIDTTILQN